MSRNILLFVNRSILERSCLGRTCQAGILGIPELSSKVLLGGKMFGVDLFLGNLTSWHSQMETLQIFEITSLADRRQ